MNETAERRTLAGIPVFTYKEIARDFKTRGVDIRDLAGSKGHFDSWHAAKGLPTHDSEGKYKNASQIFYRQYQEDPEGEAVCPPYIDFWHELLNATETVPWQELPGRRVKTVPVSPQIWPTVPEPTEDAMSEARARLEAQIGKPMPDEVWKGVREDLMLRGPRADRAREIAAEIVERYGAEHPAAGPVAMIEMDVSC